MFVEGIITLQKYLYSYTLLCDSSLFFVLKEEGNLDNKNYCNIIYVIDVIPLNKADTFFTAR